MSLRNPHESNCAEPRIIINSKTGKPMPLTFRKPKQKDRGAPKFLTKREVDHLIQVAYKTGNKALRKRNALLLRMLFQHGLRRTEAINLPWNQINLLDSQLVIYRAKNGKVCHHPIPEVELRQLNAHKKTCNPGPYVFTSHFGTPFSPSGIKILIDTIAAKSDIPYAVHPHMFRHACGYWLANNGEDTRAIQEYLGHKDIKKTEIYTEIARNRFDKFRWEENE